MVSFTYSIVSGSFVAPLELSSPIGKAYKGTFDQMSGSLKVTWAYKNPTSLAYSSVGSGTSRYFRAEISDMTETSGSVRMNCLSTTAVMQNTSPGVFSEYTNGKCYFYIRPNNVSSITSNTQLKQWLSSLNPAPQILYQLKTPKSYGIYSDSMYQSIIDQLGIKNPSPLELRRRLIMDAPHQETRTGSQITFKSVPSNLEKCEIVLDYKQSGTGDPTPTNIRPISANRNAEFFSSGKNLFGGVNWVYELRQNIGLVTWDKDEKNANFTSTSVCTPMLKGAFKPNTRYTFILTYGKSSGQGSNFRWYYTDGTYGAPQTIDSENVGSDKKQTTVSTTAEGKTIDYIIKYQSAGRTYLYYDESGIFEGVATADDFEGYKGTIARNSWGFDVADNVLAQGTVNASSGTSTNSSLRVRTNTYYYVQPGTYTVGCDQGFLFNVYVYGMDAIYQAEESLTGYPGTDATITIQGERLVRLSFSREDDTALTPSEVSGCYMQRVDIPAIYKGKLDLKTGILTETHKRANLGDFSWSSTSATTNVRRFYSSSLSNYVKAADSNNTAVDMICTNYKTVPFSKLRDGTYDKCVAISESKSVVVRDTTYTESDPATTKEQFKEAMNGVYIVYELETPNTYQLSSHQVKSLLENTVWADSGDSTIKFWTH